MRTSPRSPSDLGTGLGKEPLSQPRRVGSSSYISNSTPPRSGGLSHRPSPSPREDPESPAGSHTSSGPVSEIGSEIVVQSGDMELDGPGLEDSDMGSSTTSLHAEYTGAPPAPSTTSSHLQTGHRSLESPLSHVSDQSELSSIPPSVSSKATTPVDSEAIRELVIPRPRNLSPASPPASPQPTPRRAFDIKPRSSIPAGMDDVTYATQCLRAAEHSRLDPYSLHEGEYRLLRQHITQAQVTTYLQIRNGILRLWYSNVRRPVTREAAVGCAAHARWFDMASVCFDWLLRHAYINYGCVEFPPAPTISTENPCNRKRKTIVVIGAGMAGLGCARQMDALAKQYSDQLAERGELPPKIVVLEGRRRIGGRVYSREFQTKPETPLPGYDGQRHTAEMGGMIITGFERGNPVNVLVRGQLGLPFRVLKSDTTLYDSNGRPVEPLRDDRVEKLYNDCLDRVSEFKFKTQPSKLIRGNLQLIQTGREITSDGTRTISEQEEALAALPHAPSVSEQNVPERVNRVPVSSDKLTGRVHTEPGTPATSKASTRASQFGWTLKNSVHEDSTVDLSQAASNPDATLGSVLDDAIVQYRSLVDLAALDHRLLNWHIANLEYSNATNLYKLSLGGWDIDAGYEWDGKHTMVVGGYQAVPRGLAECPTPLDLKTKSPVRNIKYATGDSPAPCIVECEDGTAVEADIVVSTIPLGVLKQGSVGFDPPLPEWKQGAIERIGFGVLNKVILVYKEPFWDTSRHIFGVLRDAPNKHSLIQSEYASRRGRFFQWFNVSKMTGLPCLVALMAGNAGFDTEHESNDSLIEEATVLLRKIFGRSVPYPVEAVVTRWASDRFARGSYSSSGPGMHIDDYDAMARPVGNLYFAGEHTCGTHPATVHGAYLSGLRAASEVWDALLGPIDVPTPLKRPKESRPNMTSKMWRAAGPEERKPYEDKAGQLKTEHARLQEEFEEKLAKWDEECAILRAQYEKEHSLTSDSLSQTPDKGRRGGGSSSPHKNKHRKTSRPIDYAESSDDPDL
ncbi:lysine-specific histone demethylase [Sodiomyces alkalinus F11]|uniref:Lysine-specific histone demethylase n=1 Tax=Sodiomyces alkalinus (strain CBS 110278 / VKM F-3762 / F11) TaxID=1314773 RepID=A0A3N2PSS2_SODAK|nr:lysine-specific histone demethylase [Sodiomyces alkalinus F11]ROT37464.1 lysine-specific histone demethylase [Sodiomyces alkalinus F11]